MALVPSQSAAAASASASAVALPSSFEQYLASLTSGNGAGAGDLANLSDDVRAQMQAVVQRAMQQLGGIQDRASKDKEAIERAATRLQELQRNKKDKNALWRVHTLKHEYGVGLDMTVFELDVLVVRDKTEREENAEEEHEDVIEGTEQIGKRVPVTIVLPYDDMDTLLSEDDASANAHEEGFMTIYDSLVAIAIAKGRLNKQVWGPIDDDAFYSDACGLNNSTQISISNDQTIVDAIVILPQCLRRNQLNNNSGMVVLTRHASALSASKPPSDDKEKKEEAEGKEEIHQQLLGEAHYPARFLWRSEPRFLGDRDDPETHPDLTDEDERGVLLSIRENDEKKALSKKRKASSEEVEEVPRSARTQPAYEQQID
jgi:hypothetical protein